MPADSNPAGDIFGGWLLSQMDIAAGICATVKVTQANFTFVALGSDGRPRKLPSPEDTD